MRRTSSRAIRIKACELAAQCLQGQVAAEGAIGNRMMSLVVFFETYIIEGSDETERQMKMLAGRKVKHLRVVIGAGLTAANRK